MTASLTEGLVPILRRPVPAALRRRAALHVLDWIGCASLGATTEVGAVFRAEAAGWGSGPAAVLAGGRHPARVAAFANGALGNVHEMDDLHKEAIAHPGPVIVPAALAAAEATGTTGPAFLDAVVRGYEATIRLGRSMGPGHYRHFHPTATCGFLGAATAVGDMLRLDDDALVWALGNAGSQAAGLWQCRHEPVMTKQLHTARAAEAGYAAAALAAGGLTGPRYILEGPQGLFGAMAPDGDPGRVLAEADGPWLLAQTSIKPWAACRHTHAAIDAALLLREAAGTSGPDRITVLTFADAIGFCDRPNPRTSIEARFSLQHAVAVTLLDGPPTLASFEAGAIDRSDVAALRSRIEVRLAERYATAYPRRFGSGLRAELPDGAVLETSVPDALGDPENPLDDGAVIAKAVSLLAAAGLGSRADTIVRAALALPEGGTPAELTARLVADQNGEV
jgi:2-methylcitrate dehydratase PrpD